MSDIFHIGNFVTDFFGRNYCAIIPHKSTKDNIYIFSSQSFTASIPIHGIYKDIMPSTVLYNRVPRNHTDKLPCNRAALPSTPQLRQSSLVFSIHTSVQPCLNPPCAVQSRIHTFSLPHSVIIHNTRAFFNCF